MKKQMLRIPRIVKGSIQTSLYQEKYMHKKININRITIYLNFTNYILKHFLKQWLEYAISPKLSPIVFLLQRNKQYELC